MYSKYNGDWKRDAICKAFNWDNFEQEVVNLYVRQNMSAPEIVELFASKVEPEFSFTPRSLQRILKGYGVIRPVGEAFRMAAEKGRVRWVLRDKRLQSPQLSRRLRFEILERDKFRCVLCGATSKEVPLEVDHIVPRTEGGLNNVENLRTLCRDCNKGKQLFHEEHWYANKEKESE